MPTKLSNAIRDALHVKELAHRMELQAISAYVRHAMWNIEGQINTDNPKYAASSNYEAIELLQEVLDMINGTSKRKEDKWESLQNTQKMHLSS